MASSPVARARLLTRVDHRCSEAILTLLRSARRCSPRRTSSSTASRSCGTSSTGRSPMTTRSCWRTSPGGPPWSSTSWYRHSAVGSSYRNEAGRRRPGAKGTADTQEVGRTGLYAQAPAHAGCTGNRDGTRASAHRGRGGSKSHLARRTAADGCRTAGPQRGKAGSHRCPQWPPAFRQQWARHFARTPGWRWRESNPRPSTHHQGFSERSLRCLYSAPSIMQTSRCDRPSHCSVSRARPRPACAVSHLADARIRADDEPGLTDSPSCRQAARAKSR
jgi:hypothetical protein